jgi:hypothetical protein
LAEPVVVRLFRVIGKTRLLPAPWEQAVAELVRGLTGRELDRRLGHRPHRGVATGVEDEGTAGGLADVDVEVAVGTFFLAPQGEVGVEVGFGGLFEEVAEAVFAVGFPFLEQVEGEDELTPGVGDGDEGDDGVGAVTFKLEGDAGAAAGHDEAVGGEVEELAGDGEQVGRIPGGGAFGLLEEPDQAGRIFAGELGGVHGVVVLVDDWGRVAS